MRKYLFLMLLPMATMVRAQSILEEQFQFNFLALNPAMTGARETFSLNGMFGNQFNGTLRPQQVYQLFSMDGVIQQGKGGLGLQAYNSNVSGFDNAGAKLSYAYREQFRNGLTVSVGANAGFIYQPVILSGTGVKQMFPYLGLGGMLATKQFFVGLSKPVLLINDGLYNSKQPVYTMIGASVGEPENVMLNISGTLETSKGEKPGVFLTAKVWMNEQIGLGLLYRAETHMGRKVNKIVPMAEFQLGESFRLGGSYDFRPLAYSGSASQEIFQQRGIFQLYIRYEFLGEYGSCSRMKYY
ncbi:PorP/SprF family type IX secretion system membrane protein [Emticicia sp. 21SJ11W-3]|uniref:PorP/SprF family type IX secretion system membrane protein n=1 Tax=Emticicia sp. 21SJ11W-3 TaxID=2916755 RepID=UPI00209E3E1F|nr:PorP/SprF family type IX secretion system membrane protein [Emticicia sp. 21SJ11W-3]UTA67247.1 PorP/SprF family type IX secretion system membrane protein [Emticicia sp. 21SJ11W-3]